MSLQIFNFFPHLYDMIAKGGYTYIMSNKLRTVLYIGVTSNLSARVYKHKTDTDSAFVARYKCFDIIYYEFHDRIESAILREKQLKKWKREWKEKMITAFNPQLLDLSEQVKDLV
ncbi:Endonuclease [Imperialibacter sp. EC-SDR9]|jgi:putative endonuclease|nr:Endonuclease [Imperialibacter sp. 89]CAD5300142.1 Endonuclease [Imperialibacter sp. 75]VVT15089.1 Endonuclease [Imperialibacter sp. EC-SDR9]